MPAAGILLAMSAGQLASQDWGSPNGLAWTAVLFSAIGSVVLGNGLWFWAQRSVGPGRSGLYANLQPVFGVLFALLLLSERLGLLEILGGLVVGLGIVLARSAPAPPAGGE